MTCYELYLQAKNKIGFNELVKQINVVSGTMKRWESLQNVPEQYRIDLMKICGFEIDYSSMTPREKNQFFTDENTAKECVDILYNLLDSYNLSISDYQFIEPSAGSGVFLRYLPEDTIAMDIENFNNPNIIIQDFFDWEPISEKKYIVIGNPPFGLRGQQALRFINKALSFADFCAFILPPLFDSDGRGTPKKRVNGYLAYSGQCASNYHYPDNSEVNVATIYQIWTNNSALGQEIKATEKPDGYQIYSLSDGGTPSTTRNKDKLYICDFYLPSTCFGKENIHIINSFEKLPQRRGYGIIVDNKADLNRIKAIDWTEVAFYSTNGASNLRMSLIIQAINKCLREK